MNKTLVIIDGNSIINRAFYALPEMSNKEGLKTNAIYGFTNMLLKIIDTYNPTHISVAFDRKAPTFRHIEFKEYKAGRKKMPDELREQFEPLKDLLDKFNIHRLEIDGYEADDIIGTVSKIAEDNGFKVYIVTGDKDAIQLASNKTTTLITKKGVGKVEEYDYDSVIEKYEMTPTQFIDLKGLMGDKSDNIPGVPGIGEKTGIKLIKEFSSIEGIFDNIDSIKGSTKKKLEENKELAIMSKKLATIIRDVPVEFNLEELEYGNYNTKDILDVFKYLGFTSLIPRIGSLDESEDIVNEANVEISKLEDIDEFINKVKENNELIIKTVTREGNILDKRIKYIFLSVDGKKIYYVEENSIHKLEYIFTSNEIKKLGYNLKDDYIALKPYGIKLENIYFDITIAEYLIDSMSSTSYECSAIAMKYLTKKVKTKEELLGKGVKAKKYQDLDFEELSSHISQIIDTVKSVMPIMEENLKESNMDGLLYHVEMPLVEVLADMEYEGVKVDKEKLNELGSQFKEIIKKLESEIYEISGEEFNINSPKQLGVILFEKLELPYGKKTKSGSYSTNVDILEKLRLKHPIANAVLDYRQLAKLQATYVVGLDSVVNEKTRRIHSHFNQTVTNTGRLSSTEPNLQNIPVRTELGRELRKMFAAERSDWCLIDADYSQIELRVLAHIADDEEMKQAFKSGEDIHTQTAATVFKVPFEEVTPQMRSRAKAVNFGIVYGIGAFSLAQDIGTTRKEAQEYIDGYLAHYHKVAEYMQKTVEDAKKDGYITTILGRRRYIPELSSSSHNVRAFGERVAMNAPIQGSAADIIKIAMVNVQSRLKKEGLKAKLVLQVHDELIVESPEEEADAAAKILKEEMENAYALSVPLKVDMNKGKTWYDTK